MTEWHLEVKNPPFKGQVEGYCLRLPLCDGIKIAILHTSVFTLSCSQYLKVARGVPFFV